MDARDFVGVEDFERIRKAVEERKDFSHSKMCKNKDGEIVLTLDSHRTDVETAKSVWRGHDYLIGIDVRYHGKKMGIGGKGRWTDNYELCSSWENLKGWIDENLMRFDGYETVEYGQLSMF